jgi:hypothetical protein
MSDTPQSRRSAATQGHLFQQPILLNRVVYGTITMMSVLIVYDGWQDLKPFDVVVVIIGPLLAMFVSHVFAASLAMQLEKGGQLTNSERLTIARSESRFLLLGVPPLVFVGALTLLGVSLADATRYLPALGAVSLGFWGGLAGRRAGFTGWNLARAVLAGLIVGAIVLAIQVILQPGVARSGGVI